MKIYTAKKPQRSLKKISLALLILSGLFIAQSFYVSPMGKKTKLSSTGCDSVPELNKQILAYLETKINHKVGEGECWDLAAEALNTVGANWDHEYKFGREIDLKKECAFAGDIMQFKNVKINYKLDHTYYHESLPEHTAIIYEVIEQDNFNIAEQNTSRLGQKVGITPLDLSTIKSGKYKIYRPFK